jgi:starvation-inducible DNA-binding protein
MSGPRFLDYHLLLNEQADHFRGVTDSIEERIRNMDGATLTSVGRTNRTRRAFDNYAEYVEPLDMLAELR